MKIEKFQENLIAFDFDSEMVNATDMLKAYPNKRIGDYLRLKSTKEYISYLESETGIPVTVVKQGGTEQGTWMSRKLALDFASWADIKLRDFIYDTFINTIKNALKEAQKANPLFLVAEMEAIRKDVLGKADKLIEKALADDAGKYALSTLDKAKTARTKANTIISSDRYNRKDAI